MLFSKNLAFVNSFVRPHRPSTYLIYACPQAQRNPTSNPSLPEVFSAAFSEKRHWSASNLKAHSAARFSSASVGKSIRPLAMVTEALIFTSSKVLCDFFSAAIAFTPSQTRDHCLLLPFCLVAPGLRFLPCFAVFCRGKCLIFFRFSVGRKTHNPKAVGSILPAGTASVNYFFISLTYSASPAHNLLFPHAATSFRLEIHLRTKQPHQTMFSPRFFLR